jgi:hypothetical protein
MANPLDDFLSGKTERKPFSMTDYEAIPLENRQEYVKTTSIPARNQVSQNLNIEGIVPSKAPVSPTLPKLKEIFSPQSIAPEQPQQPTYTPPVATSDLVDMEKIRGQVDGMMPERGMSDWLSVLAPLATEALFGKGQAGGVSYGIAGKAAADMVSKDETRRNKLEDKLMDIEKARAIAGAKASKGDKSFQTVNIVDEASGDVIKANFDKNTGKYYSPEGKPLNSEKIRAGYSVIPEEWTRRSDVGLKVAKEKADYTPRLNPESGNYARATENGMQDIGVNKSRLTPKQEKDLTQQTDKFITSDVYKKSAATLSAAGNIDELLSAANSGNAAAANSARVQIARMSGEVGALSDMDIKSTGGSPSIKNTVKRFANLQRTGVPLLPQDIAELKEMARIYEAVARKKIGAAVSKLDKSNVELSGGLPGSVTQKLEAYIPKGRQNTQSSNGMVRVISPEGVVGNIPAANLEKALKRGYKRQ